jgi:uncharacterized membrane protein
MLEDRRTQRFVLAALCVLYTAVRLWRLTDSCLWFDEIFSVHAAEHDWGSLFGFVAKDLIHPPLFYSLLKIWITIGGENILWLRLIAVIFTCLSLIPFFLLCRELKQEFWTIALALFLLSVNGTFIKYAQLVRMYSLLMCISLVSLWLFARYFNRGKNLTALIIVNVLMVYTHYYGWLVVGTQVAAILVFQRFKWRGMALMSGTVFLSFMPWLYVVFQASQEGSELSQNISWITRPGFAEIGTYIIDLIEPFYFQASNAERPSNYFITIPLLLIFATAATLFLLKFRNTAAEEKRTVYFLALFSFLPIIAVLAASWILPNSIWGTRHLIIAAAPITLLAANILTRFDQGTLRIAAITLIVLFSGYALISRAIRATPVYAWCAWEGIATEVIATNEEPQRIYTFEDLVAYHVWFATRNSNKTDISAIKGVEGMHEDESYFLPRGFAGVNRAGLEDINEGHVWLLFRTETNGQEGALLEDLKSRGYTICPNTPARYARTNVFKVEIVKPPLECSK